MVEIRAKLTPKMVEIESEIPRWDTIPAQKQRLELAVGELGNPEVPAGKTFLMVHGITGNMRWWEPLSRKLLTASPDLIRIIAVDLRGRGDSDKPEGPYHMAAHAADMVGLLNALGIKGPITFIGHSLGAHIGTVLASSYPERVKKLVLIDGGGRLPADVGESLAPALRRLGKVFPTFSDYVAPLKAAGIFPDWDSQIDSIYSYDSTPTSGGVISKVSREAVDQELVNLDAYFEQAESLYPLIKAPTIVIRAPEPIAKGLNSFLLRETLEKMKAKIRGGARIIEAVGTNHYTSVMKIPEEGVRAILEN